jgi:hypothetical protein
MCFAHLPISNVEQFMSGGITPTFECAANHGARLFRRIRNGPGHFVRSTFFLKGLALLPILRRLHKLKITLYPPSNG